MSINYKQIATLGKFSISLPVAITALTGFAAYQRALSVDGLLVAMGIFFLSAGASALNQLQEIKEDRLMARTSNRPLPQQSLQPMTARFIIILFLIAGSLLLFPYGMMAVVWGWAGLFWYNLIYTPLKKHSAFSVFPGAIVGAIPPIAGWIAAGGSIMDIRIHFVAFFFFLGQMPHFWLLVLKYKEQYKKAGFPIITDVLAQTQVKRINFIWFLATFTSVLFFPLLNIVSNIIIALLIYSSAMSMIVWLIKSYNSQQLRKLFIYFNSFYLWVMLLMLVDQLIPIS
ncbi:MAG: protoheme IX farnesyltransferase [Carboxylicivirga sp.]|jgi:protoheme IX farnesyltransferase|nr:protoheme IX farnesyltransferase [Carboxylicivirga sp.]